MPLTQLTIGISSDYVSNQVSFLRRISDAHRFSRSTTHRRHCDPDTLHCRVSGAQRSHAFAIAFPIKFEVSWIVGVGSPKIARETALNDLLPAELREAADAFQADVAMKPDQST